MHFARRTIYWSGYIADQIVIWTAFLAPALTLLFATVVAGMGLWAGIPPVAFALDFIAEAVVALADPVLILGLIATAFALFSFLGRWLLEQGKDRLDAPDSLTQGHSLTALLSALLRPLSSIPRPFLHPPISLRHPSRRSFPLRCTFTDLSSSFPSWNRPPPLGVFS